jgi:hypothetical protein
MTTPTDWRALCAELLAMLDAQALRDPEMDGGLLRRRARTALAQPEPEGPSDEDLIQLAIDTRLYRFQATAGDPIQYEMTEQQIHAFARAAMARWGRPTIEPVPVSERLPGPEDCDAMGRCWWFTPRDGNPAPFRSADWSLYAGWRQKFTHWLPHHALPVPGAEAP